MAGGCCEHLQAGLVGLEDGGLSVSLLLNLVVAARQRLGSVHQLLMTPTHSHAAEPYCIQTCEQQLV